MTALEDKLASLELRLRLAKAIQTLKASPGWEGFCKEVAALKNTYYKKVLDEAQPRREYVAGVCSGLLLVLELMDNVDEMTSRIEMELRRLSHGDVEKDPIGGLRG